MEIAFQIFTSCLGAISVGSFWAISHWHHRSRGHQQVKLFNHCLAVKDSEIETLQQLVSKLSPPQNSPTNENYDGVA